VEKPDLNVCDIAKLQILSRQSVKTGKLRLVQCVQAIHSAKSLMISNNNNNNN